MDIIFVTLPKYLVPISIFLRKVGYRVFYLKLSGNENIKLNNIRVEKLKRVGIVPLPLEDLPHFKGFSEIYYDHEMKVFKKAREIAPLEYLHVFEDIFPNNPNIAQKLLNEVHSMIAYQMEVITGKVNVWADVYPHRNHLLIDVSPLALIAPQPASNVRLLVIPFDIIGSGMDMVTGVFHEFIRSLKTPWMFKGKTSYPLDPYSGKVDHSRVAFVTHKGLNFGALFQKNLFYSTRINSELHYEKLLHLDYSGVASPSDKLKWACVCNLRQSWISNITFAFNAISKGILHIRRLRHILGLLIVARSYVIFKSYSSELEIFPDLKMALIDYERLCPVELLLAFESKGIYTVAAQERFIFAFDKMAVSIFINTYLCTSQFAADALQRSPLNCVDHYLPVGQYRSDNLLVAKKSPPPQIFKAPRAKGLRVITALGFHTPMEWQYSQVDLLLNWKAHQHFLEDMIRLSEEIPDVFIILRYKFVDWMSLPVFAETIQKIKTSNHMTISKDYEKSYVSYALCAHSDLVIAKHTSLADECLSVGIPVLFHEYTHNSDRIVADCFDYGPTKIMCFNYQQLKERAQIILSGTPNTMTEDYEYLKNVVYGELGDGKVRERIHANVERILSEM